MRVDWRHPLGAIVSVTFTVLLGLGVVGAAAVERTSTATEAKIPDVNHQTVGGAYTQLRRAGFGVSIPGGFVVGPIGMPATPVYSVSPPPGRVIPTGSSVSLGVRCPRCASRITVGPRRQLPRYTVPNFVGRGLGVVQHWLAHRLLSLFVRFGPLDAATASRLYDNYRVVGQHPRPGETLALGIRTRGRDGGPTAFRSTSLTLRAAQVS